MPGIESDSPSLPNRLLLRRLLRYREWLVSGRGFTMERALTELEVCQRTVYRDMDYVRTLGWDVEFCRQRRQWILAREGLCSSRHKTCAL